MANVPTTEKNEQRILAYAATEVRRPGEIFNLVMAQTRLNIPANEFDAALKSLGEKGFIEKAHGPFVKITDEGFKAM